MSDDLLAEAVARIEAIRTDPTRLLRRRAILEQAARRADDPELRAQLEQVLDGRMSLRDLADSDVFRAAAAARFNEFARVVRPRGPRPGRRAVDYAEEDA